MAAMLSKNELVTLEEPACIFIFFMRNTLESWKAEHIICWTLFDIDCKDQKPWKMSFFSTSLLLTFCSCLSFTKKSYDKTLGDLVFDAFKYSNHDLLVKVQDPNSGFMRALLVPTRLATRPLRWPIGRWTQKTIQDYLTCFWFGLLGVHVILITGDVARTCKDNLNLLIQESHAMPHSISQHMKTFSICTRWFLANQQLVKEARNVVGVLHSKNSHHRWLQKFTIT